MSAREWKPGDVAMVTGRWIRTDDHSERYAVRRAGGWISRSSINVADWEVSAVRPLVVIDPEDAEQVERLHDLVFQQSLRTRAGFTRNALNYESTKEALREFANPTPPKPEEPIGHLAIVEDCDGIRWVNWRDPRDGLEEHERAWHSTQMDTDEWRDYANIAAVRVLSEGVS